MEMLTSCPELELLGSIRILLIDVYAAFSRFGISFSTSKLSDFFTKNQLSRSSFLITATRAAVGATPRSVNAP
jgi:hypothetical protein